MLFCKETSVLFHLSSSSCNTLQLDRSLRTEVMYDLPDQALAEEGRKRDEQSAGRGSETGEGSARGLLRDQSHSHGHGHGHVHAAGHVTVLQHMVSALRRSTRAGAKEGCAVTKQQKRALRGKQSSAGQARLCGSHTRVCVCFHRPRALNHTKPNPRSNLHSL
eukprot:2887747-Rhodomonas_salina.2